MRWKTHGIRTATLAIVMLLICISLVYGVKVLDSPDGADVLQQPTVTQTDPVDGSATLSAIPAPTNDRQRERVDCPKGTRLMYERSLRLDDQGRPHIVYGGDYLCHAWYDGATWYREVVDDAPGAGRYVSLALDASGNPHVSYYDIAYTALKYAHWTGSVWQVQTVIRDEDVGRFTSLALDAAGNPHISYVDYTHALKYAYWSEGAWHIQMVESDANLKQYNSLALDAAGKPHISYSDRDDTHYTLKYAHRTGETWRTQAIESTSHTEPASSLVLDAAGNPHISFNSRFDAVKYAYWQGASWQTEIVTRTGEYFCGGFSSLAIDASENLHLCYYDCQHNDLKYAHQIDDTWEFQTVAREGNSGYCFSLALDASNNPHFSYYDFDNKLIKYVHWTRSGWEVHTVDSAE